MDDVPSIFDHVCKHFLVDLSLDLLEHCIAHKVCSVKHFLLCRLVCCDPGIGGLHELPVREKEILETYFCSEWIPSKFPMV